MPEEQEQQNTENQSALDQEALDQMLADSQGDVDQLESMLNHLEDEDDAEATETGDDAPDGADLDALTDDMEAMLNRMESEDADSEESDSNDDGAGQPDALYQATFADTAQPQAQTDSDDDDLDAAGLDAEDSEDDDDALDMLVEDAKATSDAESEGDLNALLADVEAEASKEDGSLDTLLESVAEDAQDDLDAMLADVEDDAESEEDDLDAMLADMESNETSRAEASAEEDLNALLEDEAEEEPVSEEEVEEENLDALLADVEDDGSDEDAEESVSDDDLDALLGDAEDTDAKEDLDALLEDVEDTNMGEANSGSENVSEETDFDALLADVEEDEAVADLDALDDDDLAAALDGEVPADEDVLLEDVLLEDVESEETDDLDALLEEVEGEAAGEASDFDALLADMEDDEAVPDLEMMADDDLDGLLEEDVEDEDAVSDDDLDALLEDVEEDTTEAVSLDDDLDDLLGDEDMVSDDDDLDALLADEDDVLELSEDADLDNLLASASEESTDDLLETDDDLDDLLGDLEEEDFSEDALSVGVEDEVAQILATGKTSGIDGDILDDFKSVQESIISGSDFAADFEGGTLLVIDGDADNRSLFEDALEGKYEFEEAERIDQGLQILHNQAVDLIVLGLDDDEDGALEFVEQVTSNLDMPSVPIIVVSEYADRIENALRLGAVDYFKRPLDVMDVEFQVPQKIANQVKLQKAERILAGAGGASILESDSEDTDFDLDALDFGTDEDDDVAPEDLLVGSPSKKGRLVPLSDQQKMLRNRQVVRHEASRIPLFAGIVAILVAAGGAIYHYADEIQKWIPMGEKTVAHAPLRPQQPLPKVKMPTVPKQNYASSSPVPATPVQSNTIQRQAEVLKGRIRQNVQNLVDSGGSWWSPWRVMRASGASVSGLVDRRSVNDILNAFGVDMATVERNLQSQRTLEYLAGVGFDLRGKRASDLSGRETFELLSAREIKSSDQIVDILSKLTDRLADDRTAQEEHKERERRKLKGHAMLEDPRPLLFAGKWESVVVVQEAVPENRVVGGMIHVRGRPPILTLVACKT